MARAVLQPGPLAPLAPQRLCMSASGLCVRVLCVFLCASCACGQQSVSVLAKAYRVVGPDVTPFTADVQQAINSSLAQFLSLGFLEFQYSYFNIAQSAPLINQSDAPAAQSGGRRLLFNPADYGAVDVNITIYATSKSPAAPSGNAERSYEQFLDQSMGSKGYPQAAWLTLGTRVTQTGAVVLAHVPVTPLEGTQYVVQVSGPDVSPFSVEKQSLLLLSLAELRTPGDGIAWTRVLSVSETPPVAGQNSTANVTLVMARQVPSNVSLEQVLARNTGTALADQLTAGGLAASTALVSSELAASESLDAQIKALLAAMSPGGAPTAVPVRSQGPTGASAGLIGGLVAGSVVFASLCAAGAFLLWRRRQLVLRARAGSATASEAGSARTKLGLLMSNRRPYGSSSGNSGSKLPDLGSHGSSLNSDSTIASVQGWELQAADLEICKRPDGSPWLLGTGSFGQVFKAKRGGVQTVAVKVLAKADPYMLKMFHKEIQILKSLSFDRNIVQFYGACLEAGDSMLVLEYMEGGDLREALSGEDAERLCWHAKGQAIALDIAAGLHFLHQHKVIHSDLKSKNILLTADYGTAKIADVGLARIISTEYVSQMQVAGTFAYAAPELLLGERMDEKADIYSFGVVLWELVTHEVAMRGQLRPVKVPQECPPAVAQLIDVCLQRSPDARPSAKQIYDTITVLRAEAAQPQPGSVAS